MPSSNTRTCEKAVKERDVQAPLPRNSALLWAPPGLLSPYMPPARPMSADDVKRALARDRTSLEQLVHELEPVIRTRVAAALWRFRRASRAEVEDLTQEVFVELFSKEGATLASWDAERGLDFHSFVSMVAQRVVLSVLRSRRRSPFTQELLDPDALVGTNAEASQPPAERVEARELLGLVAEHLRQELSPQGLELFYRLFVWQESVDVVTRATGLSADAIYQWRTRLKKAALLAQQRILQDGQPS